MSDEVVEKPGEQPPPEDDAAIEQEVAALAADPPTAKDKVSAALIARTKELRIATRKNKELEAVAGRVGEVSERLQRAQPIIDAVLANPKLLAEAQRLAGATRPSAEHTEQPIDDREASDEAEDRGWFLSDGVTPDAARGRRALDRMAGVARKQAEELVRPLAGSVLGSRAEQNVQRAINMTDDDGVPLASRESIEEAVKLIGGERHLLANPQVADLLITVASGLDRRHKRTPKAPDEPLYLDRPGGGRPQREPAVDAELSGAFARLGIDPKKGAAAVSRLESGVSNRRGVTLGSK